MQEKDVKLPNSMFYGGSEPMIFYFFKLTYSPLEFYSRKIHQHFDKLDNME